MADSTGRRRELIEREFVSALLGSKESYEKVTDLGFKAHFVLDMECRRSVDILEEDYRATGEVPSLERLEQRGILFRKAVSLDPLPILYRRLQEAYAEHRLQTIHAQATRLCSNDPLKAAKYEADESAKTLEEVSGAGHLVRDKSAIEESLRQEEKDRAAAGGPIGIPWPLPALNRMVRPMTRGIYYVYGRKKSYKSTLSIATAVDTAEHGIPAYVASTEMSEEEIAETGIAFHGKLSLQRYLDEQFTPEEKTRWQKARESFFKLPLFYDGDIPLQGRAILEFIRRRATMHEAQLVVFDGIQNAPKDQSWEMVKEFAIEIKNLARMVMGVPWLLNGQGTKDSKKLLNMKNAKVTDSDLDVAGGVIWVQIAKAVLRMRKERDTIAEIDITDNRRSKFAGYTIPIRIDIGTLFEEYGAAFSPDATED